ncbi:MAG: ubiquinol-cytochrome c reductase iron-sulfur subunit [Desulfomonilaceae bacterium]|nr:ubiquinol-cytochrome c reductase iron-sulfur subunit [Desulfomonilaceae bacterium]
MTTRSFIKYLLLSLAVAASGMAAWGIAMFSGIRQGKKSTRQFSRQIIDDLRPGQPVHVSEAGAWLIKRDDEVVAFDDRCTHLGCRQKWNSQESRFECPCHGSIFDIDGNVQRGPAVSPMPRLYLRYSEGNEVRLVDKPPAS